MGVPQVYRKTGEPAIATFDFYDLATGTGYKSMYPMSAYYVTTDTKVISSQVLYGASYYSICHGGAGAMNISFDLDLEVPMTLGGDALFNIPLNFYCTPGDGTITTTISASLYKVNNGVETQLGVTTSGAYSQYCGAGANVWDVLSGKINIPTETLGVGEQLRLKVHVRDPTDAQKYVYVYYDPKDRTPAVAPNTDVTSTKSVLVLPILIDK